MEEFKFGMVLTGMGLLVFFFGRVLAFIDSILRSRSDERSSKIENSIKTKQGELNESNKNSTNRLDEYNKLKSEYDKNK